jgi:Co/Zn/Cd efflux system component
MCILSSNLLYFERIQIFAMTLVTMIFALLGFLSPSDLGGVMTAMVLVGFYGLIMNGMCFTLMLYLFQHKMVSVIKWFQERHFSKKVFRRKHFSVFGAYGKMQIFFIFSFNHINL